MTISSASFTHRRHIQRPCCIYRRIAQASNGYSDPQRTRANPSQHICHDGVVGGAVRWTLKAARDPSKGARGLTAVSPLGYGSGNMSSRARTPPFGGVSDLVRRASQTSLERCGKWPAMALVPLWPRLASGWMFCRRSERRFFWTSSSSPVLPSYQPLVSPSLRPARPSSSQGRIPPERSSSSSFSFKSHYTPLIHTSCSAH